MTDTRQLLSWLDEKHSKSQEQAEFLREDSREDEAVLEKVRANIYGMFRAMLEISARLSKDDPAATKRLFFQRAESVTPKWESARQKAEANGDILKMTVEKLKQDTYAEIRASVVVLGED